jgi:hypothetical protein
MKWLLLLSFVIAAFLGWFLFVRIPSPEPGSGAKQDPFCRKLLDTKGHREAPAWVKESKDRDIRTIGEQSPEDSSKIVERLYQEGAERVWAVDLEIYPNEGQSTNDLVIELPNDPKLRARRMSRPARIFHCWRVVLEEFAEASASSARNRAAFCGSFKASYSAARSLRAARVKLEEELLCLIKIS